MTATRTPALDPADAELLAAARLRATRLQPYLASAVFALVAVPRPGFGTFGVDRWWRVYFDPAVAHDWGVARVAGVLLHEAHHVVRDHHKRAVRAGGIGPRAGLWNLAGDAAINDDLVAQGVPLPDPVLPRHLNARAHQVEEAYFRHLLSEQQEDVDDGCGSGAGGTTLEVEIGTGPDGGTGGAESGDEGRSHGVAVAGVDDVDAAAIRRAVAHDVVHAADRGDTVSPALARWARDLLSPQVPWRALLRSAVGRQVRAVGGRSHDDWCRPDRRADSRPDFPRPGIRRHRPDVAVVIDTSGSMSQRLLDTAATELNALLHRAGAAPLHVVACDVAAVRTQRVRRLGQLVLRGGGGTDLRVGIATAATLRPAPKVVIVLTDGLTPWPPAAPPGTRLVAVVIGDDVPLPTGAGMTAVRIAEAT